MTFPPMPRPSRRYGTFTEGISAVGWSLTGAFVIAEMTRAVTPRMIAKRKARLHMDTQASRLRYLWL